MWCNSPAYILCVTNPFLCHARAEKKYLLDVIPEFFAKDTAQEPAGCTRDIGRIDFLHAPLFATHGEVNVTKTLPMQVLPYSLMPENMVEASAAKQADLP